MHRIDGAGATPDNRFTEGDEAQGIAATEVTADFLNALQEEVSGVIEGAGNELDKGNNGQLWEALCEYFATTIVAAAAQATADRAAPPGLVAHFSRTTPPAGWLEANGAAISRTDYAALFAVIGTTYGIGNGATTFNLPDLRGEFIRGWDHGRGVDPGRVLGSTQEDSLESHTHDNVVSTGWSNGGNIAGYADGGAVNRATGATGGTETRPRNVALLVCIKC